MTIQEILAQFPVTADNSNGHKINSLSFIQGNSRVYYTGPMETLKKIGYKLARFHPELYPVVVSDSGIAVDLTEFVIHADTMDELQDKLLEHQRNGYQVDWIEEKYFTIDSEGFGKPAAKVKLVERKTIWDDRKVNRIEFYPDWSSSKPWCVYLHGIALNQFPSLELAKNCLISNGSTFNGCQKFLFG